MIEAYKAIFWKAGRYRMDAYCNYVNLSSEQPGKAGKDWTTDLPMRRSSEKKVKITCTDWTLVVPTRLSFENVRKLNARCYMAKTVVSEK